MNDNVTIVTGLWDLGRGEINGGFGRSFDHYLEKFEQLLKTDINMYIHVPSELESWVWERREVRNTKIRTIEVEEFKKWFAFYDKVNTIRQDPDWYNYSGWLADSPQRQLRFYNPIVMSKMFMLNDATIFNPFGTEYFFWIDGGITNTCHWGYFSHDNVFDNLPYMYELNNKFLFLKYPYEGYSEIHGFRKEGIEKYCGVDEVNYVCRGGFFGGRKDHINQINSIYYNYLQNSLNEGYMGTEESIFTIIAHRHEELTHCFPLEGNGLVWPFFEELKNIKTTVKVSETTGKKPLSEAKVSLYVITFNIPEQFEMLCKSFEDVDRNFLDKTRRIVLNNSTDRSTDEKYNELFQKYGFEEVKMDNIGIHGGRQWCAEHFGDSDSDYYFFFEDDMLLAYPDEGEDKFGFKKYVPDLFNKTIRIFHESDYDFLKLTFTEFYGDNSVAWQWYNIPQDVRDKYYPKKRKLPVHGLDPNAPKQQFNHIYNKEGITYIDGTPYYCNWPLIMNREGNRKIFLETKWARPFEQTHMSYVFQEQMVGNIKAAVYLLSPITHNRKIFYNGSERREN